MPADTRTPYRRGQVVLDAVLDTTLEFLAERGYGFSVEEVATEAGVHKTTIYRRWATKAVLVGAAVERLAAARVPFTRTGRPIEDLTALAVNLARSLRSPLGSQAIRAIAAAAAEDPDIVEVAQRFLAGRYHLAAELVTDAIAVGEIRDDVDPVLVWQAIVNPLHMRALLSTPGDDDIARQLVVLVLDGARPVLTQANHRGLGPPRKSTRDR
ncbi:MAG: TetR/AcrR family transcriptional regulator [Acidimicrobiales bacterium]